MCLIIFVIQIKFAVADTRCYVTSSFGLIKIISFIEPRPFVHGYISKNCHNILSRPSKITSTKRIKVIN